MQTSHFSTFKRAAFCAAALICLSRPAHAQWQTTTYNLKAGWNAIYLTGDIKYGTLDNILPASVLEVWRWNSNPTQVQFTRSPLIPSGGTAEWTVWKRGLPAETTLTQLTGQSAYLVKCSGASTAGLLQAVLPPRNAWVRNGANLLGFPSNLNGASYPTFSSYFATFPAAIASNAKIFKYIGGDLGAGNPIQVFSPAAERLDRTQAYWFSAEVAGEFYAPLEISSTNHDGITFGRTGSVVTVRVRNRTSTAVTLSLTPVASENGPPPQTNSVINVPLTKRTYNTTTLAWTEAPIVAAYTEAIGPLGYVELSFGIDRAAMTGSSSSVYASFLRFKDSTGLMDVYMPVSASKTSLAGLWVGDIAVKNVSNLVSNGAKATATLSGDKVSNIAVKGTGGFGYTTAPLVTIAPPASGTTASANATVNNGAITGFVVTNQGSGYKKPPIITIDSPPPLTGTATPRAFPLRTLIHISDTGESTLLSQVFIGQLADNPYEVGICTLEERLKQDAKAAAQRLVAAHLPLRRVIESLTPVNIPSTVEWTVNVPYNDATNPFIHQYHPDHDNLDARFNSIQVSSANPKMSDGVEAPTIKRLCRFTFTANPPSGSTVTTGWGSSVIGGTYSETISGIHKNNLQIDGTFELRRASEIGKLTQ